MVVDPSIRTSDFSDDGVRAKVSTEAWTNPTAPAIVYCSEKPRGRGIGFGNQSW